jgi:transposase
VANFRSQEELLLFVEKQKEQAEEVVVVYEAGPLGYVLYRALKAREMSCYVCAPDSGEQKRKRRKKPHRNPDFNRQFVQLPQWQRATSAMVWRIILFHPQV